MTEKGDGRDDDLLSEVIGRLVACGLEEELTEWIAERIKEIESRPRTFEEIR